MKEPYRSLYGYLGVSRNWPLNTWVYNVKLVNGAFYIGTDDDHITILEGVTGFHHSFNENGVHVTRQQHPSADTIWRVHEHISANPRAYPDARILNAVTYIANNIVNPLQ